MQYGNHVYLAVQESIGIYVSYLTLTHQPLPLSSFALPPLPSDGLLPSTFMKPRFYFIFDRPHHIFCHLSAIWPIHVMPQPQCIQGKMGGIYIMGVPYMETIPSHPYSHCLLSLRLSHTKAGSRVRWTEVQTLSDDYLEHNLNYSSLSKCSVQCICNTWK